MLTDKIVQFLSIIQKAEENGIKDPSFEIQEVTELRDERKVSINKRIQGQGSLEASRQFGSQLTEEEKEIRQLIDTTPIVGEAPPALTVYSTQDPTQERRFNFDASDPKVYLLDFWATWCGPCQGPMAHNQEMLVESNWEDKVEIVCISLDDAAENAQSRIEEQKWDRVSSYWAGSQSFESDAAQSYGIQGIPSCFLIHKGKLVWQGHPSELDLKESINKLTRDEELVFPPKGVKNGEDCPQIVAKDTTTLQDVQLDFNDGKVYFLDFWATWCGPCQVPMAHNQQMLESNPHWEGKAEIVALSLDDTPEDAAKRISEKGWDKVKSYFLQNDFQSEAAKRFNIEGIPSCFLVQNGKVVWQGHPSSRNIEQDINSMVQGNEFVENIATETLSRAEIDDKLNLIEQDLKAVREQGVNLSVIFTCACTKKQNEDPRETYKLMIRGTTLKNKADIYRPFIQRVKEQFPFAQDSIDERDAAPAVQRGDVCNLCSKQFTQEESQYICLYCEPQVSYCQDCENQYNEQGELAHNHYIYKLLPTSNKLDELIFGSHTYDKAEGDSSKLSTQTFGCNCDNQYSGSCTGQVIGIRWKCAHCPDYDFCNACAKSWPEGFSEAEVKVANERGHFENHVMIKLIPTI